MPLTDDETKIRIIVDSNNNFSTFLHSQFYKLPRKFYFIAKMV
jgi:hypothetical protein